MSTIQISLTCTPKREKDGNRIACPACGNANINNKRSAKKAINETKKPIKQSFISFLYLYALIITAKIQRKTKLTKF